MVVHAFVGVQYEEVDVDHAEMLEPFEVVDGAHSGSANDRVASPKVDHPLGHIHVAVQMLHVHLHCQALEE